MNRPLKHRVDDCYLLGGILSPKKLKTRALFLKWTVAAAMIVSMTTLCLAQATNPTSENNVIGVQEEGGHFIMGRNKKGTIVLEPYAPNIIRITLSVDKAAALAKPGYGIIGQPSNEGWSHQQTSDGFDVFRSSRIVVRISPASTPEPSIVPRNPIYQGLINKLWGPPGGIDQYTHDDVVSLSTPEGKPLLTLWAWTMYHHWDRSGDHITDEHKKLNVSYNTIAKFDSPADENYYGLGQHQMGSLNLRDSRINCWHDYNALGGQSVGVPFMISSRGYGFIWDNPSKTTVDLGINDANVWASDVADSVSFFVIASDKADEIYEGYRHLTGVTHLLPKGAYGYTQSRCIYPTQDDVMQVAKGYRDRNLPLDTLVVDFLHAKVEGDMDLDPERWPNPTQMNQQLGSMGIKTMISVWPHFATNSKYYDMLKQKGWFIQKPDGSPDQSFWGNNFGPDIDTTNPDAAKWWWSVIRDNYIKDGFDYIWLDETEPDISPQNDFYYIGAGDRYYNIYPLFHSAAIYDGFRRDFGDSRRVMSLARDSYLGAQSNGVVFWSSDIVSSWDMLRRSITAGLNFTASGMAYWDTDIGGYARRNIHSYYDPATLVNADADSWIGGYKDLPELYVRWFQWAAFQPVMRAHGEREFNEVWSFGKQATPILEKYLRLRYQMLPYTYSLAYGTYQTGSPFMRALWMDFPHDPNVANLSDEYMYGPALLIAPVTVQGATSRRVYLPAGSDWYNFWTNEKLAGGKTVEASAQIDTIPIFVRSGSIIPFGSNISNADQPQTITSVRVYPGADANFTLFNDDGQTYAYEKGAGSITQLHWDDTNRRFSQTGAPAWTGTDAAIVDVIKPANK